MDDRPSKRQHAISTRLNKLEESFRIGKDHHYRQSLQQLQVKLSTIHQGTNEALQERIRDIEESRDYELLELFTFQNYELDRAESEFEAEINKANKEHDDMVKLVKEKLFASLEKKVKQHKEDKVLREMANSHSYNMDTAVHDQLHKHTRSSTKELTGYLSDMRRAGLRRQQRDYSTNAEDSANDSGNNSSSRRSRKKPVNNAFSSHSETDTGADLSSVLFPPKNEKVNTRHSTKSFTAPMGLKNEEVSEDLALISVLAKR